MDDKLKRLKETEVTSELIFDGRILHLYKDTVELPNGERSFREYCKHNGGVCVLPLTDNGEVILVEQYRYAHRTLTLEIPAGKLEGKGEDHAAAALRELREETGAECKTLTYLGAMYPTPALIDEVIYMYMAEGLTFGEQELDSDEFLDCVRIPLGELVDRVCRGEIPDAKTQVATLRAWKMILDRK